MDVELSGIHTTGQTVVDVWGYLEGDDTWGRTGKNCEVVADLDVRVIPVTFPFLSIDAFTQVAGFFELFFECVAKCDEVSPLNR